MTAVTSANERTVRYVHLTEDDKSVLVETVPLERLRPLFTESLEGKKVRQMRSAPLGPRLEAGDGHPSNHSAM